MSLERQRRIRELDGWRALSVLMVIAHHLFTYRFPALVEHRVLLAHIFADMGSVGVNVFFVISGFVICRLMIDEEKRYGSISLQGFYVRRIFRILPPLFFFLAAVAALMAAHCIEGGWKDVALGSVFLTDLFLIVPSWFTGHTWSLAVEEQFYLIFPALWLLTRTRPRWRVPIFASVFLLFACWNLTLSFLHTLAQQETGGTRAGFSCICIGVLMALREPQVRRLVARLPRFVAALAALMLLITPVKHHTVLISAYFALIVPLAIALVLMYSVEHAWLRGFLLSRPMQTMGLTSYGIYLWQQLFTGPVTVYYGSGIWLYYSLPLLFVIVPVSYLWIEKPAMQLGKLLSQSARKAASRQTIAAG